MTDLKTLKELVKLMSANGLTELDLQDAKGERVTLKRATATAAPVVMHAPAAMPVAPLAAPATAAAAAPVPPASAGAAPSADDGLVPIKSPMVGTFYSAATPDAKPFVAVGDRVGADTVVCIVEAMKVFNEIKAETGGTIQKILVSNGQAVEFGQPLYLVKP